MADKSISELVEAKEITGTDLFVLEQAGAAKKLSGQTMTNFLLKLAEGHGGITNIAKTGTSGLEDTYTITMADESTTTFTVTNGAKGDKGAAVYTWIKYSSAMPTQNSDMYDTPDNYMGIYTGTSSTAPTAYSDYKWFQIKGDKGDTGAAASLLSQSVKYQVSSSGTVIPSGTWLDTIPAVPQGQYLWTQSTLQFNSGSAQVSYSVAHSGMDGTGAVVTVNSKAPDDTGNVTLTAADVGARADAWMPTAAQVGARPSTWMPTAADVGAIPDTGGAITVSQGGTGATTFTSGAALIGAGTGAVTTRSITNSTAATTAITASTNLVTMNTLRYALNRTTGIDSADTNYTTAMVRAIKASTTDLTAGTSSLTSGQIYLVYE